MLCERSCPDGVQDYFNHVMTLLFEITEYNLNKSVLTPYEKACSYYPGQKKACMINNFFNCKTSNQRRSYEKNYYSAKVLISILYNPPVSRTDSNQSFIFCPEMLKQNLTANSNLTGVVVVNPSQRNCYVVSKTHYTNFVIQSTLGSKKVVLFPEIGRVKNF